MSALGTLAKAALRGAKKGIDEAAPKRGGGKAKSFSERVDKQVESLLTSPTKGQQKVEDMVKSQRVYRQGQNKAGAAGAAAGAGAMYVVINVGGETVSVPVEKANNPKTLKPSDIEVLNKDEASDFEKAFSEAFNNGEETFMFNGKEYAVELKAGNRTMKAEGGVMDEEVKNYKSLYAQMQKSLEKAKTQQQKQQIRERFEDSTRGFEDSVVVRAMQQMDREKRAEGGSMLVPPEMPIDTYSNIPEDEIDDVLASQKPDDEMEKDYVSYVMSEALSDEEVEYVNNALESDNKLSQIFDKLILSAAEFDGAGEVEGPGDGTSDDIPARLSDGEFVFTEKATKQLGAENLQKMMDDAERAYDGGLMKKAQGGLMNKDQEPDVNENLDIQRQMLRANRMPSLIGG